jgi:hypothetical protein
MARRSNRPHGHPEIPPVARRFQAIGGRSPAFATSERHAGTPPARKECTVFHRIIRSWLTVALLAVTISPALADHYPNVRPGVRRHDRSVLEGMARMTFAESYHLTVSAGYCNCFEPVCDGGFMVACGGEVLPFNGGSLTAARRTSRETCLVCGCAAEGGDIELRATPVCIGF